MTERLKIDGLKIGGIAAAVAAIQTSARFARNFAVRLATTVQRLRDAHLEHAQMRLAPVRVAVRKR